MAGTTEVFADGVGEVTLVGGMVRIDLVSLSHTDKDESGQAYLEHRQRIVMPPEGFLRSFSAMEDLVKQLVEAGVIRKGDDESAPIEATPASSEAPPASPNFSSE